MHLYFATDFNPIERLIHDQENITTFNHLEKTSLYGLNVWMVYVPGDINRKTFFEVLKKCPLHLNSHVFELFEAIDGNLLRMIVNKEIISYIVSYLKGNESLNQSIN